MRQKSIPCEAEKPFEIFYEGSRVGLYYIDVWIDNGKIILENKVKHEILPLHKGQALSYLKITNADLALVVNFGSSSLQVERLPNFLRDKKPEFDWVLPPILNDLLYPELTNKIMQACHRVHFVLGTGFLHQVYRRAVMVELNRLNIDYDYIKQLPVEFMGHLLGYEESRVILVEENVLLATVAYQEADANAMISKMRSLLKRLDLNMGIVANFRGTICSITPVRIR